MEKTSETMNLTIKFGVKNFAMSLPASSKVSDLMQQLQTDTGVLPRVQKLIFKFHRHRPSYGDNEVPSSSNEAPMYLKGAQTNRRVNHSRPRCGVMTDTRLIFPSQKTGSLSYNETVSDVISHVCTSRCSSNLGVAPHHMCVLE